MAKKTAANKFNIPRATLQFRLSNQFVKSRPGPDTVLSSAEEQEIVKWIVAACSKGFPRRKEDVIKSVKLSLDEHPRPNNFIDNTPGEGWYKLFLKRHPELSTRTSEAVTSASSKLSEKQIRNWFTQIEEYLKENYLFHILSDPSRVYNGDETNFILCPKGQIMCYCNVHIFGGWCNNTTYDYLPLKENFEIQGKLEKIKVNRLRPMIDEELLKMLEDG